jgi:THUMP domain-containing protein/RNA cap guanine-N2 methyltransferase
VTSLQDIHYLQSATGAAELSEAAKLDLDDRSLLAHLSRLRERLRPEQAAAILEQTRLRRRALSKFSRAGEMLFTPEGLEQSSGETLARHSARRFAAFTSLADCCCGIGGDTIALAATSQVDAYDIDPVRPACATHNVTVHGFASRAHFHLADVEAIPALAVEAIFFDPSRRAAGRRIFSLRDYHPPVSLIESWQPQVPAIGVKVAPGVSHEEVVWDCEQEFVAEGPNLKEGLLWFGPLARSRRTATVLPESASLVNGSAPQPSFSEPRLWLYDPSPAVTRAGLVWELAALIGASQLDPDLAYLTSDSFVVTPFARAFAVEAWTPFNLKRLKALLHERGIGRTEVRRRGAPIDPAELQRKLRQEGSEARLVFLTRMRGRLIAIICRND